MLDHVAKTAGGGFNLLLNPFLLLKVAPTATAQDVIRAFDQAVKDARCHPELLQRARQVLLTPSLRVDAEVGGLIGLSWTDAVRLHAQLIAGPTVDELEEHVRTLPALPRSNVLAHLASRAPSRPAELLRLLEAQSAIDPEAVLETIGEVRLTAGFVKPDGGVVGEAIGKNQESQTKAAIEKLTEDAGYTGTFAEFVRLALATANDALIHRLDVWVHAYSNSAWYELSRRREEVVKACSILRKRPKDQTAIERLVNGLRHCNRIGEPLQLHESHKHRDDPLAREISEQIRAARAAVRQQIDASALAHSWDTALQLIDALLVDEKDPGRIAELGELQRNFRLARDGGSAPPPPGSPQAPPRRPSPSPLRARAGRASHQLAILLACIGGIAAVFIYFGREPPRAPPPPAPAPSATATVSSEPPDGRQADVFTLANVRDCLYQNVRIAAARSLAASPADLQELNQLVNDWSSRCSGQRYPADIEEEVVKEIAARRSALEEEGRALANAWPSRRVSAPAPLPPPAVPTSCAQPPDNGAVLTGQLTQPGHTLEFKNSHRGDAIIKLRNGRSGRLTVSFFVMAGRSAVVNGIPDGVYRVQYATGTKLDADCRSFSDMGIILQFRGLETLAAKRGGRRLHELSWGNPRVELLDRAIFNAD